MSCGSTPNIQTQSLGSMETLHPVHISYEKGTPQDIGSKETVHPVHISYEKGTPRTYRVYGNGTSSTMSYSYEKGTPPGHRVHGNGTPSTYYPEHRHTYEAPEMTCDLYLPGGGCWLLAVSMATYRSSVKPPYLTYLP